MKNKYDVVIIGAGIAGQRCAKNLLNTSKKVLLIENNKKFYDKICAGGITPEDMKFIDKKYYNFDLQKLVLHHNNNSKLFSENEGIITTINRSKYLKEGLNDLLGHNNIDVLYGNYNTRIVDNNNLIINDKEKICFTYLIGADGSNSLVRKYLKVPIKKLAVTFQYIIDKKYEDFDFYLDYNFPFYIWNFPHKEYSIIGCGSDISMMKPSVLKEQFNNWLKEKDIEFDESKIQIAPINYDYRGYRFGNIFLAGDAAGLTSGLSGKGIYSAQISANQITNEILDISSKNLILEWLKHKKHQEFLVNFMRTKLMRKITYFIGFKIINHKIILKKIRKIVS